VRIRLVAVGAAVMLTVLTGCSSDSKDSGSAKQTTTTTAKAETLDILVSNDDGYSAEGIDTLVQALRKLPNVDITVSAPATNKSGTGSKTTPGELTATQQQTKSGYPATAVNGFPADSVNYGLAHVVKTKPDVVLTGVNQGQNLGPVAALSGTVGAAKAGAAAGIPSLASSAGGASPLDYQSAAKLVVNWVTAHRAGLLDHSATVGVVNLNVPTCSTGSLRGVKQEPLSPQSSFNAAISDAAIDCSSTATTFTGDVEAFNAGFATVTQLTPTGETVTTSTTWPAAG
jgi:5'-nucleotidase